MASRSAGVPMTAAFMLLPPPRPPRPPRLGVGPAAGSLAPRPPAPGGPLGAASPIITARILSILLMNLPPLPPRPPPPTRPPRPPAGAGFVFPFASSPDAFRWRRYFCHIDRIMPSAPRRSMPVSCIAVASSFATIKVGPWPYRSNKLGPPSSIGTRTSKECRKNDAMDSSVDSSRSPTRVASSTPYFSILAKSFVLSVSISRTISSINRHLGIGSRTMCSADGAGLSVAGVRRFFAPTPTPSPKPAGAGVLRRT